MTEENDVYGFVLDTTKPHMRGGDLGTAYELVKTRLERKEWPLFERTRSREKLRAGARVAFYVAGKREMSGKIVAKAVIESARLFRPGAEPTDPTRFVTDRPHTVLKIRDLKVLDPPVDFREAMPRLTIRPANPSNWGSVLQGGVRSLNEADWKVLLGS
jgi:hypothetical protein